MTDDESGAASVRIAGYASVFDVRDLAGDVVRRGAFAASLMRTGAAGVRMLFQHEAAEPIGVWDSIVEDGRGLWVEGRIITDAPRGAVAAALVSDGAVDGLSIGFRALRDRVRCDGARELLDVELWEVSIVTFPMAPGARLSVLDPEPEVGAGRVATPPPAALADPVSAGAVF